MGDGQLTADKPGKVSVMLTVQGWVVALVTTKVKLIVSPSAANALALRKLPPGATTLPVVAITAPDLIKVNPPSGDAAKLLLTTVVVAEAL